MQLTLLNAPNQNIPFVNGTNTFILTLATFGGCLFSTIIANGEAVTGSRRVVFGDNLFGCKALEEMYGTLVLKSRYGAKTTDYMEYNKTITLEYTEPEE